MIELFIEGQLVDTTETFSSLLNYAIDDVTNFGSRETTFSKTIILPGTKRNNVLFGNIWDFNGANDYSNSLPNKGLNFNAAISASAFIFNDNLQCFKGIVRLLEIVIDNGYVEYEISVFGELGGFISKLGNKKLEDLDFSSYNHILNATNISASWDNSNAGQGYYYPLIDYGTYSSNKKDWQYKTFRPALFAKEYIDKMFLAAGYTYDCDLFNTSRFKGLIIPHNQRVLTKRGSRLLLSEIDTPYTTTGLTTNLLFDSNSLTDFTYSGGEFTYTNSASQTIDLNFELFGVYRLTNPDAETIISIQLNGVTLDSVTFGSTLGDVNPFEVFFTLNNILFNQNDILRVRVVQAPIDRGAYSITFNTASLIGLGDATSLVNVNLDDEVLINDAIPKNILQKDFFASIVKLFNLYVFEDSQVDKLLKIKPFVDFYADAQSIDWSLKLDRGSAIRIRPMSELNSRYYEFKFKQDADFYNDTYNKRYNMPYGTFLYDSQFEFTNEKEVIELIFSPTVLVGYASEDKVYSTLFKRTGTDAAPVEENTDTNIRLLQAKKITDVESWDLLDGATVLDSYSVYPYAGHFDDPDAPSNDIQFGTPNELFYSLSTGALNVNQFNVYYSSYMAEITDKNSKLLIGTFRLQLKDIANLDFSKLVYIDGSLFRLNKITDFNATKEDICKVELLKVINKIY